MEKHLQYRSKVLVQLHEGIVFLLLLFCIIHRVSGRQLSGKGGDSCRGGYEQISYFCIVLKSWVTMELAQGKSSASAVAMLSFSEYCGSSRSRMCQMT